MQTYSLSAWSLYPATPYLNMYVVGADPSAEFQDPLCHAKANLP